MEVDVLNQNMSWRDHSICEENRHLQELRDIIFDPMTSKEGPQDCVDEDQMQQSGTNTISNGDDREQCAKSPSNNQCKVNDRQECTHTLEQDQSLVESRKRILWRPYKEPIRFDFQDSHQRSSWIPNSRFQEGIQQNTFKTLRKPSVGSLYTPSNERSNSPLSGFYHGKSTNLRGTIPFLATQHWAKKTQIATSVEKVKDIQEEKDFQEHKAQTSSVKDAIAGHVVLVCETNCDKAIDINRVQKEHELNFFEKNEFIHVGVPMSKVVANTRGLNNIETSFNLNVNSEDWPPLTNSNTTSYSKNCRRYPLTSHQCELSTRRGNELNIDRRIDYQTQLESKVEGPIHSVPPSTSGGSITIGCHKGILVGSVSVPLGDYMHQSKPGLESTKKRICTPLQINQSYTSALLAPRVCDNQDSMTNIARQQIRHEEMKLLEFEKSSNMQVIDSFGGPNQYRTSTLRSTSLMNINEQHVRGSTFERPYTYPIGDRGEQGILSKQPSWLNGPIRHASQKIWRPIQSTIENNDPNSNGKISIEGNIINENVKIQEVVPESEHGESLRSVNDILCKSKGVQVWHMDINKTEYYPTFTTNLKNQLNNRFSVVNLESVEENALSNVLHLNKSIDSNTQHLECQNETSKIASMMLRDDIKNNCHSTKCNIWEQETTYSFQNKNDNIENTSNKMETTSINSSWIDEVVEFHWSRWHAAMKDSETIISKCEVEHHGLQTSVWINFIDS